MRNIFQLEQLLELYENLDMLKYMVFTMLWKSLSKLLNQYMYFNENMNMELLHKLYWTDLGKWEFLHGDQM